MCELLPQKSYRSQVKKFNFNLRFRDLKPENILLEQNKDFDQIKIIDFGTSL